MPRDAARTVLVTLAVRFELDSRTPHRGSSCRDRHRVIRAEEALTSWERGPGLARFAVRRKRANRQQRGAVLLLWCQPSRNDAR
jgi:hypothetical protein